MSETPKPTPDSAELVSALRGTVCRCGKHKQSRMSFCAGCYGSLPQNLRGALYRRVGEGYEEAYAAAAAWLDEHKKPAASAEPTDPVKAAMQTDEYKQLSEQAMPKPAETSKSEPESTVPPTTPPKE